MARAAGWAGSWVPRGIFIGSPDTDPIGLPRMTHEDADSNSGILVLHSDTCARCHTGGSVVHGAGRPADGRKVGAFAFFVHVK